MSTEQMRRLVEEHVAAETRGDLAATMRTLVDHPVYEFHPARLRLADRDAVARFYREQFGSFFPLLESHTQINQCWDAGSACFEYDLRLKLKAPYYAQPHRITVVLTREGDRLIGERLYTSGELLTLMTGTSFADLVPF